MSSGSGVPSKAADTPWPLRLGVLLAFVLAFAQRPGKALFDSRVELSVDPGRFLGEVLAVWSPSPDLGHVAAAQFVGYLVPMGPWFAFADVAGLPTWVAQRLWVGALIALAGIGAVRLVDTLLTRRRGVVHLVAAVLYAVNPYVLVHLNRGSVTLLAYVALPWLLVAAHRGLHAGRSWRWPLAVAVLVALAGGGVNAAVLAWVLLAPAALVVYEVLVLGARARAALAFGVRTGVATLALSLWWIVPVLVQGRYGADFLAFTEQPVSILATNSLSESLRLLGYWPVYLGVGFGESEPLVGWARDLLFTPLVVLAGFALPLLAFGGLARSWRWRFAPFFALLGIGGVTAMAVGFPDGSPMNGLVTDVYYEVAAVQFLRTPYKAAPLAALSMAVLAAVAVAPLVRAVLEGRLRVLDRPVPRAALALLAVVPLLAAWPLVTGRAPDAEQAYGEVPEHWERAVADAGRASAPGRRTMVLPGTLFGRYAWGETASAIAPALAEQPVVVREIHRWAAPRSSQLLAAIDDRVQQGRLLPGQLPPLLGLLGVDQVLVGADDLTAQTGALPPALGPRVLSRQPGLDRPVATYGPPRTAPAPVGRDGRERRLASVRRHALPAGGAPGVVRAHPRGRATVLDGDGDGVAALAAHGALDPSRALFTAGDVDRRRLAELAASGASLVITDSARRRVLETSRTTENRGATLGPDEPLPRDWPAYDLFPALGQQAQTVALHGGVRAVRSPLDRGFAVFPERRPFAALDGRTDTSWIASTFSAGSRRWLEVDLDRPRVLPAMRVLPHRDPLGRTTRLAVSLDGGPERTVDLAPGWTTVPVGGGPVRRLRLRVAASDAGPFAGPGGIAELRLPGVRASERLRLPLTLARRARGLDLSRAGLAVLLERTTADFPGRAGAEVGAAQGINPFDMVDAEPGLERELELPEGRRFAVDGWAGVDPRAPDEALDRLTGVGGGWRMRSSSRFEGAPGHRASSAFDGDRGTAWVGDWMQGREAWLEWRAPVPIRLRTLRLEPGGPQYASPARVVVETPRRTSGPLDVGIDGRVTLPRAVRTDRARIRVLALRGVPEDTQLLRAVAVGEVVAAGLRPPAPRRDGPFASACGALRVAAAGAERPLAVSGAVRDLDAGLPLRVRECGPGRGLALPGGRTRLSAPPGRVFRPDHLRLDAPAPVRATAPAGGGTVTAGTDEPGRHDDVRVALTGPSWLVLAESHSPGWRAWCRGADGRERALGAPVPIDAYGNGWPVDAGCRTARFAFAPQAAANAGYAVSAGAALLAALAAAAGLVRRRRRRPAGHGAAAPPAAANGGGPHRAGAAAANGTDPGAGDGPSSGPLATPRLRLRVPAALAAGLAIGLLAAGLFALRAGAVLGPLAAAALVAGVTPRRLGLAAGAAVALMPVLYLVDPAPDLGGSSFFFALHHVNAHWLGVGVVAATTGGALLAARAHRRALRRPAPSAPPAAPVQAGASNVATTTAAAT